MRTEEDVGRHRELGKLLASFHCCVGDDLVIIRDDLVIIRDDLVINQVTQGPIIPPEPMHKRRGRKTVLRRKEVDENPGFSKGKVSKKGVKIKCSLCGATGHNKRYHGQNNTTGSARTSQGFGPVPEIITEHTAVGLDLNTGGVHNELSGASHTQMVTINVQQMSTANEANVPPSQPVHKGSISMEAHLGKRPTKLKGGVKVRSTNNDSIPSSGVAGQRSNLQQTDARESSKAGFPNKRRKVWLPPGLGSSAGAGNTYKKAP